MPWDLPLLPTATTGATSVPSWLLSAQPHMAAGDFGRAETQETLDDAVIVALHDQLRAGLDVVGDGEVRRVNFIMGFYSRLDGVRAVEPYRKLGLPLYDQETLYQTTHTVSAPHGLGAVEELSFVKQLTDRPIKMTVPGPLTLMTPLVLGTGYKQEDDLIADLAAIVRAELVNLQAAGCEFVQIDEPAFHAYFQRDLKQVTELFNRLVDGLTMKIALHVCFGNYAGRPRAKRSYRPLIPFMADARASQLVLEFANREMAEIDLWPEYGGDKELAAGVVDQKSFYRETPADVAERVRLALQAVPPEKLWLNPDCGLMITPRWLGRLKLKALVDGTAVVRQELGG